MLKTARELANGAMNTILLTSLATANMFSWRLDIAKL